MNDLDSRARAIVQAGRDGDAPSLADRDRIKRAVLVQIVAGGVAASTAAAGTLSVGAKAGLAVLAVALVGGGTFGVVKLRATPAAVVPAVPAVRGAPARAAAPAPAHAAIDESAPQAVPAPAEERVRKAEKPRRLAGSVGKPDPGADEDQVGAEVEVLKRAREALRLGRPAAALEALAEYDRRFGRGVLGEERHAIAAIAACQATPGPAARAEAEAFMRRAPTSPLRERVREACITLSRANTP